MNDDSNLPLEVYNQEDTDETIGPGVKIITLFSLDDFGLADRIFSEYGTLFRYITDKERLYVHDGKRFGDFPHIRQELITAVIKKLPDEYVPGCLHMTPEGQLITFAAHEAFQKKSRKYNKIKTTQKLLPVYKKLQIHSHELDADIYSLNVQNGMLDLRTGVLTPHDPSQLVTKIAPIHWVPDAECHAWHEFIDQITLGDVEMACYLKRLVGYCLCGSTQEEILPILYGNGANGKSVFLGRIRKLLGPEYAVTLNANSLLSSIFDSPRYELKDLKGARAAFGVEINSGQVLDESTIKKLTGGDEIGARGIRERPIRFTPQATILMAVNHLPGFVGNDRGIHRRLQVVPFRAEFDGSKRKEELEAKLDAELEGILLWAVQGFQEWLNEGLTPPECVRKATEEYLDQNDHIKTYLSENTIIDEDKKGKTPIRILFENYEKWAFEACVQSLGYHEFGKLLRARGFEQGRTNSIRFWKGITLRAS